MYNFEVNNPVIIHFGQGVLQELSKVLSQFGRRVLLVYGQGSIKRSGLYQEIQELIKTENLELYEYGGILANPRYENIDEAAKLAKEKDIDVILAVGGGSVLDSSKIISVATPLIDKHSSWAFFERTNQPIKTSIPLVTVLTVAATGSEMNMFAVVQNDQKQKKLAFTNYLMYPAHSFLDPKNTLTVNKFHTACGVADTIAHCLENYFSKYEATLTDRIIESILQEAITYGKPLINNLQDLELREKIMYSAMMALNGMTLWGKGSGDWGVHAFEHSLSALYNIAHGAGLAILYPNWLEVQAREYPQVEAKVKQFGRRVLKLSDECTATQVAIALRNFFNDLELPATLSDLNIEANAQDIFENIKNTRANGAVFSMADSTLKEIIQKIL